MTNTIIAGIIGGPELIVVVVIILLLFGGKRLPGLMRGIGKGIREFKEATNTEEFTKDFRDIASDLKDPLRTKKPIPKKEESSKKDEEKK